MQKKNSVLLRINNLSKAFGKLQVLKNFDLSVKRGERLIIIGPSGGGKSTALRCIMGLESIDGGDIWLDGKHYIGVVRKNRRMKPFINRGLQRKIGMVFQSFNLFPHLSVLDNLILAPTKVYKVNRKEAIAKADSLLKRIGLESKIEEYPSRLSGGQRQRVAITRAMMLDPQLMLFDEITSALDPELIQEVLDVLGSLANQGMTMIVVTHELDFARQVADKVVFMDGGKIVEEDRPEDILTSPRKERTKKFLGHLLKGE